jgi:hypothetical protein
MQALTHLIMVVQNIRHHENSGFKTSLDKYQFDALVVRVVMKKNHVRKNVFIHSVIRNIVGILKPTSRTLESLQR